MKCLTTIAMLSAFTAGLAPTALAQAAEGDLPSYSTSWEEGFSKYRSIMFPHEIDGCKVMIQSKRFTHNARGTFIEEEGPDCNCDLVIDGREDVFQAPPLEYTFTRQLKVCEGPSQPGNTRRLEIMRESLKEDRDFSKMKNVEGF